MSDNFLDFCFSIPTTSSSFRRESFLSIQTSFTPKVCKTKIYFLLILTLILVLPCVMSIGITPARTTVNFESDLSKSVSISVVNSEGKDINLVVAVQGELAEYVSLGETAFSMSAEQSLRDISYNVNLPSELSPGLHTAEIVVLQLPDAGELGDAFIGAAVAVVSQLHVYVSYPGKYAEADLSVFNLDDGNVKFVIPVISRGDFDLTSVKASIEIFTSLNEKVATLNTNEIKILSGERKEVTALWDTTKVNAGPYRAVATLIYDEETLTMTRNFNVGQKRLSIESVEVNDFALGDIAKFEILVKNDWSEDVKGAYSQMLVRNDKGEIMADFKSPTYDVNSLDRTLMTAFWDTAGVRVGTYDASLFLHYEELTDEQDLKLEVNEDSINVVGLGYVISERKGVFEENQLLTFLVIGVILLILINIGWFLFLRRRLKK